MATIDLTTSQQQTLTALVNNYQPGEGPVKTQTVAENVDRTTGTVQNQMQRLSQLGVVEGVSGPSGGYKPTKIAYEVLDREPVDDSTDLTLAHGYDRIDVTVDEIRFTNVHHPDTCRARIHLQQSVEQFSVGQPVAVGPTPLSKLVIAGEIEAVDGTTNTLLLEIAQIEAPVDQP
jgi:predicted transcriptional regulator